MEKANRKRSNAVCHTRSEMIFWETYHDLIGTKNPIGNMEFIGEVLKYYWKVNKIPAKDVVRISVMLLRRIDADDVRVGMRRFLIAVEKAYEQEKLIKGL